MPLAQLEQITLHYVTLDQPRPIGARREEVVMVHGLGANLGFWYLRIAPMLSAYARVTLFDLRGHGLSEMPRSGYGVDRLAADMRELLDHLGIGSAHLVAHSFGGSVAAHFACLHPDRVKSLTLVDTRMRSLQPNLRLRDWAHWPRYRDLMRENGFVFDEDGGEFGIQLFNQMARLRVHEPDRADRLGAMMPSPFSGKNGKRSAMRWLELIERTTALDEFGRAGDVPTDRLPSLRMPIVGLYGEYSQALETARELSRLCEHADIRILPRAGHFFPLHMPEKVVEPVARLLDASWLPQPTAAPAWMHGAGTGLAEPVLLKKT